MDAMETLPMNVCVLDPHIFSLSQEDKYKVIARGGYTLIQGAGLSFSSFLLYFLEPLSSSGFCFFALYLFFSSDSILLMPTV